VEKAHKDVFDLLLPVLDEGVLADSRGLVATFGGCVNILTSNVGAAHFQNPDLTPEQAKERALADLNNPNKDAGGSGFRPEFLGRLDGIFFFNNLGIPQIEMIAGKELKKLARQLEKNGIVPSMSETDIKDMVADHHHKEIGGRGIRKYINGNVKSEISRQILKAGKKPGTVRITYNKAAKKPEVAYQPRAANANAAPVAQLG
jgi:ATP-dependent Clp protease ATP-binding subunit ClpB